MDEVDIELQNKVRELATQRSQQSTKFDALLKKLDTVDEDKRVLWKEIYDNAVLDRENSYIMFLKLVAIVKNSTGEHAVHGRNIATYIERMTKANDQLLKLSEQIFRLDESSKQINPDDLFSQISKNH